MSIDFAEIDVEQRKSAWVWRPVDVAAAFEQALSFTNIEVEQVTPTLFRLSKHVGRTEFPDTDRFDDDMVVVTATKREADRRSLPIAISVAERSSVAETGAADLLDLSTTIASLSTTNLGLGRNKFFIRGLSDGAFADRSQSTVGVYLADTPLLFNETAPALRLFDLDRVEVLKGPQSTLFGASNVGGIVRLIPSPTSTDETFYTHRIEGRSTQGGAPGFSTDAVANFPLIPSRLGLRLSAYRDDAGGFIDRPITDEEDINATFSEGVRANLRFDVNDQTHVEASHWQTKVTSRDAQYTTAQLQRENSLEEPYSDHFRLNSVKIMSGLAGLHLTSITSRIDRSTKVVFDSGPSIDTMLPQIGNAPVTAMFEQTRHAEAFSHGTRVFGSHAGIDWLLGAYLLQRTEESTSELSQSNADEASFLSDYRQENREAALFSEVTVAMTPRLSFTAGARAQYSDVEANVGADGFLNSGVGGLENARTERSISPRIAFTWQANDTLNTYVQATRGTRIGGLNFNTPLTAFLDDVDEGLIDSELEFTIIDPDELRTLAEQFPEAIPVDPARFNSDKVWNTEIGIKYLSNNSRVRIDAALYHLAWVDIQTDQILPSGFTFVTNAGDARILGFEVEGDVQWGSGWRWEVSLSVNESALSEPAAFLDARAGAALPTVAAATAATAATAITFPLPEIGEHRPRMRFNSQFVGPSNLLFAEDTPTTDGFWETGAQLSYTPGTWRFDLFVDNIFNAQRDTFAFGNPFSFTTEEQTTPLRPRTVRLAIRTQF
ncbi:MAG: TonB-dependent receptor [Pseudomonadota bacterium]